MLFADFVLHPGGIASWLVAGLIVGWLASKVMESPSYGIVGDLFLGSVGALVGGASFGFFVTGEPAFWIALLVAFVAAWIPIGVARSMTVRRSV